MSNQNYKCKKDYWDNYENWNDECKKYDWCKFMNCDEEEMTHVHEFGESVKLAEEGDDRHNHRTAGVTGQVIPINGGRNHVHKIKRNNTDFLDHFHQICITTGPAIPIPGTDKHVHLVSGRTTIVDGHFHEFLFTTQIEAPLV